MRVREHDDPRTEPGLACGELGFATLDVGSSEERRSDVVHDAGQRVDEVGLLSDVVDERQPGHWIQALGMISFRIVQRRADRVDRDHGPHR